MIESSSQYRLTENEVISTPLTCNPGLVTLDASDGLGKSTLSFLLAKSLGEDEEIGRPVVLLSATNYLLEALTLDNLRKAASRVDGNSGLLDKIYCASTNRAYSQVVIPALNEGKIVVVDRSEVDLMRYAIEKGDEKSLELRRKYISTGVITGGVWAGNRIFLTGCPEEVWENLKERGCKSKYDPQCLEDVRARIEFQKQAEREILKIPFKGSINQISVKNTRIEDVESRDHYLHTLVNEIKEHLILS